MLVMHEVGEQWDCRKSPELAGKDASGHWVILTCFL